ncbi:class I SAM-dependent methyltransferase [Streptomyces sp. NPDC086023]|uniref:class I SAM-dependent methyltransferase n=1 Tax=Streptomyces sp. NPDC086023 TaxID=3365746 RepID=UPI0037D0ED8E
MSALSSAESAQQRHFDAFHAARARTPLVSRLYAEAMGEAYPVEVDASSSADWTLLGTMLARLGLAPGQRLVDLGCGTGGVGLWLARALGVGLTGIDVSSVAVGLAAARREAFVPPVRTEFRVGSLEGTGLPDAYAHGAVCVDAMGNAADRGAALRELRRILVPGGRAVVTRAVRGTGEGALREQAEEAGLVVEHVDVRPDEPAMWQRLYELWLAHEEALRRDLGDVQAENMLREARRVLPLLPSRRAYALTLRRPGPALAPRPIGSRSRRR